MENKSLITSISKKTNIDKDTVTDIINMFVDELRSDIEAGFDVDFLDLGVFGTSIKEQKIILNPKTQKKVLYPPKNVVNFTPAKAIKDYLKTIEK